jgi:NAD+ diphosphatase
MWPTAEPDFFDRDEALRLDDSRLDDLWEHPDKRVVAVHKGHVDVAGTPGADRIGAILLGLVESVPWFAVRGRTPDTVDLRAAVDSLSPVERSAALTAVALDNWHEAHTHCARCGTPTEVVRAGWVRRCPQDGAEHFPRTDPAVITLVIDDEQRALLGRRAVWPQGWFSTLAGFVEPGETFEQAVVREVAEEADVEVRVSDVRYRTTQPWPFPSSIMIAFTAHTHSQPSKPDGDEIAETMWVSREQFETRAHAGTLRIPPRISVAHHLIADWYGEPIPYTWSR